MANLRIARRSGLVLRGGVNRRQTLWIPSTVTATAVVQGTAVLLTSLNADALALRPFTVVRTRGFCHLASDQAANSERQWVNWGAIVVSDEAVAVGITAVPTPIMEAESDWHFYLSIAAMIQVVSATSVFEIGVSQELDSKAMRKVDNGEDLITVVEAPATGISEGVVFRHFNRALVKLH